MAERVIKISNILCEIFDRASFVKHSIISVLIIRNGVTEVIPQIGSIIYMLNNNRPKIAPWETPKCKCSTNDFLSLIWMYWRRSHYSHVGTQLQFVIQYRKDFAKPNLNIFWITTEYNTVSNAF